MMRWRLVLVLLLTGCTFPSIGRPKPLEIHSPGTTLYVLDTREDFIDDLGVMAGRGSKNQKPELYELLGLAALQVGLRAISESDDVDVVGVGRAKLYFDEPTEMRIPESKGHPSFEATIRPFLIKDGKYVEVDYSLKRRTETHQESTIFHDQLTIPVQGSVVHALSREDGRSYTIILHLASVEPDR